MEMENRGNRKIFVTLLQKMQGHNNCRHELEKSYLLIKTCKLRRCQVPGFGPALSEQLVDRHLFGSQVTSQEVDCVLRQMRGNDRTSQIWTPTALEHLCQSRHTKYVFNFLYFTNYNIWIVCSLN